jgi:FMN phosphatase YigB (HAD superfamily)
MASPPPPSPIHRDNSNSRFRDAEWFAGFTSDLHNTAIWSEFYTVEGPKHNLPRDVPPLPSIDGEVLFWNMMRASREADPWMYPALKNLKASGRYILAALSNTVIFPPGHPYNESHHDIKSIFDIFVSSAHVGMRKPNADIYEYTVKELDRFATENASGRGTALGWENGVKGNEIVFLDDIGENLKAAKRANFGTIKVNLGRAFEAVDQLEELTGLKLAGNHPRIAITPKARL